MHLSLSKGLIKTLQRLGGLCKYYNAAYRAVQPVRHPHKDSAGLAISCCHKGLQSLRERLILRLISLNNFTCPLVENQEMIILIEYPAAYIGKLLFCYIPIYCTHNCRRKDTKIITFKRLCAVQMGVVWHNLTLPDNMTNCQ